MKIKLSNQILDSINTQCVLGIPPDHVQYFHERSGVEHYRLLTYFSNILNEENIIDIGTYRGTSAVALSQNKRNNVLSIDIENRRISDTENSSVEFYIGNFITDADLQRRILSSKFIFLDIDHLYENEIWLYDFLVGNGWKGTIVCDDIHLNDPMKKFWSEVQHEKIDITKYGHWSGTGVISINGDIEFECQ